MSKIRSELVAVPLSCPIDGRPLFLAEHGLACQRGHNYNLSRHGYVNLLPVRLKPSKDPGDSRAMVEARSLVLRSGLFESLATDVAGLVSSKIESIPRETDVSLVVDAGCGEGYYTDRIRQELQEKDHAQEALVLGVDISKWAITAAAKFYKTGAWAVANNKRLPVVKGAASIITSLFGFETWHPWADLQNKGQLVITASPGPRHLIELRELVYDEVHVHEVPDDAEAMAAGYEQIEQLMVSACSPMEQDDVRESLLAMTPHSHRMDATKRTTLNLTSLSMITIDVLIRVYQRR